MKTEHLSISTGNVKMGKVASISVLPIVTCNARVTEPGCCGCSEDGKEAPCYIKKLLRLRKSMREAYQRNTEALKTVPWNVLAIEITEWLKSHRDYKYFRWNVSGDLYCMNQCMVILAVAKANPDVKFWLFTKQYDVADFYFGDDSKPDNLNVILSAWNDKFQPTKRLLKKFAVAHFRDGKHDELIPKHAVECSGECETCGLCATLRPGEAVYFNKH